MIAEIAQLARPRYHIAGGQGLFYTRPPYINKDLGAGIRATRFVGLGAVNNSSKQKFLHALALQPSSDMTPEALSQQPDGSTPSPYELNQGRAGKRRAGDAEVSCTMCAQQRCQQQLKRATSMCALPSS